MLKVLFENLKYFIFFSLRTFYVLIIFIKKKKEAEEIEIVSVIKLEVTRSEFRPFLAQLSKRLSNLLINNINAKNFNSRYPTDQMIESNMIRFL